MKDNWRDINFFIKLANKQRKLTDEEIKFIKEMGLNVVCCQPLAEKQYARLHAIAVRL